MPASAILSEAQSLCLSPFLCSMLCSPTKENGGIKGTGWSPWGANSFFIRRRSPWLCFFGMYASEHGHWATLPSSFLLYLSGQPGLSAYDHPSSTIRKAAAKLAANRKTALFSLFCANKAPYEKSIKEAVIED